jgi:hypothetical protein
MELYFIEQLYKINPDRLIIINPKTCSGKNENDIKYFAIQ